MHVACLSQNTSGYTGVSIGQNMTIWLPNFIRIFGSNLRSKFFICEISCESEMARKIGENGPIETSTGYT